MKVALYFSSRDVDQPCGWRATKCITKEPRHDLTNHLHFLWSRSVNDVPPPSKPHLYPLHPPHLFLALLLRPAVPPSIPHSTFFHPFTADSYSCLIEDMRWLPYFRRLVDSLLSFLFYLSPLRRFELLCVTFDTIWNLLAFGLNGNDWNAGTQDTWSSSSPAASITISGRPPFDATNTTCYLSQYANAVYAINADSKNPSSIYIYDATAKSWSTQAVDAGSFDNASFHSGPWHCTNDFYALSQGNIFSLDMGLLKAANNTPLNWVNDEHAPYSSSYVPVVALAQIHIHFLDVPGTASGSADIFVIHYSYFQPQAQAYPISAGSTFTATYAYGQATSFFQADSTVQQEFAFIPEDFSSHHTGVLFEDSR